MWQISKLTTMKAFVTHFSTILMLLISLAGISLAIVSSQSTHLKKPNPCFSNQQGTVHPIVGKCTSYTFCQHGLPIELSCPPEQGFSDSVKKCVTINSSDCSLPSTSTSSMSSTSTTLSTLTDPSATNFIGCGTNERSANNKAQCLGKPFNSVQPYPGNCKKFLLCDCEYPTVISCPGGLLFSPTTRGCVLPGDADCQYTTTTVITSTTETSTTTSMSAMTSRPEVRSSTTEHSTSSSGIGTTKASTITTGKPNSTPTTNTSSSSTVASSTKLTTSMEQTTTQASTTENTTSKTEGSTRKSEETTSEKSSSVTTTMITTTQRPSETTATSTAKTISITGTTTLPTDMPSGGICSKYKSNALFPYNQSCTEYIFCQNGMTNIYSCPNDYYFNNHLLICDKITNGVKCSSEQQKTQKCLNQNPGTTLPSDDSCQQYIRCEKNGGEIILNCPENSVFNPSTGICEQNTSSIVCKNNKKTPTTQQSTPTTVKQVCKNKTDGQIIPYPNNCRKYITCIQPAPVGFSCPYNMSFNSNSLECEFSTDNKNSCTIKSESNETSSTNTICNGVPVNGTTSFLGNCNFFIRCFKSSYMLESCNLGEYYDPAISECSANASPEACKNSSTPMTTTTESSFTTTSMVTNESAMTTQTSSATNSTTTTTPIPSSSKNGNICCNKALGTQLSYPDDKHKFIICEYPVPIVYTCPSGSAYDDQEDQCIPEESSPQDRTTESFTFPTDHASTDNIIPTYPTGGITTVCKNRKSGSQIPYSGDCTKYYFCFGNGSVILECDSKWYFDPELNMCVPPNTYQCPWH